MKSIRTLVVALAIGFMLPTMSLAAAFPRQATLTGVVINFSTSSYTIRTTSAVKYVIEAGAASLWRKNGAAMRLDETQIGDKLEARGQLWSDNSMNAVSVRNLSLYPHTGTFSGKIIWLDPANSSFSLQSGGTTRTIRTDSLTTFKANGKSATFRDLQLGMSATVRGQWDRSNTLIAAKSVDAKLRLINITLTGEVILANGGLNVLSSGVMYGVDDSAAKCQTKSGKTMACGQIMVGDSVRVTGKHVAESPQVQAESVKVLSR